MELTDSDAALISRMAKRIFSVQHPKRDWVRIPNYTQLKEQARYLELARALFLMVREANNPTSN